MTDAEIRAEVLRALASVAPEVDAAALRGDRALREQVDLDSLDFLNFLVALHRATGVEVPETDYEQVATLDGCVAYVGSHAAAPK